MSSQLVSYKCIGSGELAEENGRWKGGGGGGGGGGGAAATGKSQGKIDAKPRTNTEARCNQVTARIRGKETTRNI